MNKDTSVHSDVPLRELHVDGGTVNAVFDMSDSPEIVGTLSDAFESLLDAANAPNFLVLALAAEGTRIDVTITRPYARVHAGREAPEDFTEGRSLGDWLALNVDAPTRRVVGTLVAHLVELVTGEARMLTINVGAGGQVGTWTIEVERLTA